MIITKLKKNNSMKNTLKNFKNELDVSEKIVIAIIVLIVFS